VHGAADGARPGRALRGLGRGAQLAALRLAGAPLGRRPCRPGSGGLPERRACGRVAANRRGAVRSLAGGVSCGGGLPRRMGRRACGIRARAPAPPRWRPAARYMRWLPARTAPHMCAVAPRPFKVLVSATRERRPQPGSHAALHVERSACDARTVRGLCARLQLESNACWRVDHRLHCR
jgi:hypothetical protein